VTRVSPPFAKRGARQEAMEVPGGATGGRSAVDSRAVADAMPSGRGFLSRRVRSPHPIGLLYQSLPRERVTYFYVVSVSELHLTPSRDLQLFYPRIEHD